MVNIRTFYSVRFFGLFLLVGILACNPSPGSRADAVYVNGHILTMDEDNPHAEAFAVSDGHFLDVGKTEVILKRFPGVDVIDLKGQTVMPGIVESHGHLLTLGQSFLELNLEGIKTPEEVIDKVQEQIQHTARGEWVVGWGWDEGAWAAKYPDNASLDKISPDNPVYLRGLHGFASWVNSRALNIAGVNSETENPEDGQILKDPHTGQPTGILTNKAQEFVESEIPPLNQTQIEKALRLAHQECLRNGLTTVHEARVTRQMLNAFQSLKAAGELDIRIYAMLDWTDEDLIDTYLERGPNIDSDNLLTVRCVKIFIDGALGSRGAAFFEPYSDDPSSTGVVETSQEAVMQLTKRSLQSGYQVAVHAIGDRANRIALDAYRDALEAVPVKDHRLRIEHAQVVSLEDIPKFAELNIVLSMQPPHATSDMTWAETRVGPKRILGAYAWRSLLGTGVHLALNSDFPGETLNPFFGMYAAETRKSPEGLPAGGWYPQQILKRAEVLKAYTAEAAFSGFEEHIKGQISKGLLADFIILSNDIETISSQDLLDLQVQETFLGGRSKFKKHVGQ